MARARIDFLKMTWALLIILAMTSTGLCLAAEECGGNPADVVFVLDASTSIWGPNFDMQLSFIQEIVDEFDIRPSRTRCGLVTFSDYVRVEFDLDTFGDSRRLSHAIDQTSQLQGSTRTDLALLRTRKMFDSEHRRGVPKLAIVLTDGESEDTEMTAAAAEVVHKEGITVFAIGIGDAVNRDELNTIASSEDYVFEVDTFDALFSIRKMLAIKACKVEEGWQGDAPAPTPPTKGCDGKPADVVFALDTSSSIWGKDFEKQMDFVQDLVRVFEISKNATRIGVLTFGDHAEPQFYLHKYTDLKKLSRAIGRVQQSLGNTNTAAAIRTMRKQFFSKKRARDSVVHIGVVITDGRSDDPLATAEEARLAREDGIHLFAIGVGHDVDQRELYAIASEPAGQYVYEVTTYEALGSIKHLLAMKTCEVTEPPTTLAPTTTTAPPSGCSAQLPADIVFALPEEATDTQSNHVLKFIRGVTRKLDIDSSAVRFGLVPKHCYTVPGFDLKTGGQNRDTVIAMLSSSETQAASTGKSVIEHMCEISFQPIQGARNNAKKIGVVFVNTARGPEMMQQTAREAKKAREEHGVEIMIVGVGEKVSENELNALVGRHMEGNIVLVPDYKDLRNLAGAMTRRLDELCLGTSDFQIYHL